MSKKHTPSFPRSCVGMQTETNPSQGMGSHAGAWEPEIMDRMIFDGEQLGNLMKPLELGWKARTQAELALMEDLVPLLKKQAQGREISGLAAYE